LTEADYINPTSTSQASVQSQGFGTRTGVFPGTYLGNVDNGTLTGSSNSFSLGNGSSTSVSGTLSGTVTGVLGGYTLTGTGSFSGTSNTGQTINYTGPITITPNGALTFNYTGSVAQGTTTLNAAGTMTENFGIAVSQSSSGTYQVVSGGSNPTLLNTGQMTGNQYISGGGSPTTNGSLALSYGNGSGLPPLATGASGTFSVSGAGAVSPWYGGQPTYGVLSSTVTVNTTSVSQTPMQVTYNPTTGNLTGQVAIGGAYSNSYINAILATTPTSSGQTTTSIYQTFSPGTYQLSSSSPYGTGVYTNTSPLSGTMLLGGSGAIVSAPITANFNLTGTGAAGAFPPSDGGMVTVNNFLGAVAGPATGTQTGFVMGSASFNSSLYSSSSMGFGGVFTLGPNTTSPPLQASLTIGQGNSGTSPYGYPMSVTGTWTQSDPPAGGTQTAAATSAASSWGPNSRPLAWAVQRAASLASQGGTPPAATAGAGANTPLLSTRLTQLTGTSLGSRIQRAAQLTQPGTPGNPALAANLQAAWRFRQQQRLAALRAASGATPGGQTSGNPAGPILALQRH
jgi:hypothetical protein